MWGGVQRRRHALLHKRGALETRALRFAQSADCLASVGPLKRVISL
jgi:hypothetical protein